MNKECSLKMKTLLTEALTISHMTENFWKNVVVVCYRWKAFRATTSAGQNKKRLFTAPLHSATRR
jgi:hypothetical protein